MSRRGDTFYCGNNIYHSEIAFNEEHLNEKLDGDMAIITMPDKPLIIRLYRWFFPLKENEGKLGEWNCLK